MQETRTGSPGGSYASPTRSRHHSAVTNFSRPATASTASAAQYTKALLGTPPPPLPLTSTRGGTPASPTAGATGSFARPAGGVFAEDESDSAQYTFYREGTPTPSDTSVDTRWERRGKRVSAMVSKRVGVVMSSVGFPAIERGDGGGRGGGISAAEQDGNGDEEDGGKRRVCGIPMGMFWCLVIGVGMVVIGLAVGLGLGLGLKTGGGEAEAAAGSQESTPSTTSSARPTSTLDTQPITADITCPEDDDSRYVVASEGKSFHIQCGVDYTEDTEELGDEPARDMEECVKKCAKEERCKACGWGYKGKEERCWLKGKIGGDHEARSNWTFAILQE